ncbi:DNA repair protein [Meredithblackwellia eburnea MCA 4105]
MPSTPPGPGAMDNGLTPERVRIIEENRLKAKIQERERQARAKAQEPGQSQNNQSKRPLQVAPADSTSPTAPSTRTNPSRPATRGTNNASNALQNNSRGGFLMENEEDDPRKIKERQQIEENKRKRIENARKRALAEPSVSMDRRQNPKCIHCGSLDLDIQIRDNFGVLVCYKCKTERPDEYSLLTKTECKEDYLLTDPELKDAELLPHLLKPNPHRPTYSNMMLFLRCQVEAFAFSDKKWGSPEALDAEFARRESEKKDKKAQKFNKKLQELRQKTRTNVWHKRVEGEHRHVFGQETFENKDGDQVQRCTDCGFEVVVEVF